MKQFKKWWNRLLCSNNENFRIVAESSWRAALEWVLTQEQHVSGLLEGDIIVAIVPSLEIRRELQDE